MSTTRTGRPAVTEPEIPDGGIRRAPRLMTWLAPLIASVSVLCTAAAIALNRANQSADAAAVGLYLADVVLAVCFPIVAALILVHDARNRIGRALLTTALLGPYLLAGQYAVAGGVIRSDSGWPLVSSAAWFAMWGFLPYFVVLVVVPILFPDGHLASVWRLRATQCAVALIVALGLLRMFAMDLADADDRLRNPLWVLRSPAFESASLVISLMLALLAVIAFVGLVVKMRRVTGDERAQLQWLVLGVLGILIAAMSGFFLDSGRVTEALLALSLVWLAVCMGVAILWHGLFDVELALKRSLVYGLLTMCVLVAYLAVIAAIGSAASVPRAGWFVVAVAALLAAAAHDQVRSGVDRLLYGARRDPLAVASAVRTAVGAATSPIDAARAALEALIEVLRLPYARLEPMDARVPVVQAGLDSYGADTWDVRGHGELVGVLEVGHRSPTERFSRSERSALANAAAQLGGLLTEAALTLDLQRSRERILISREEERRRVRRDLHDGIGPALAGTAMQLDRLVARLDATLPNSDESELGRAAASRLRATVGEIRRIVDDLRPAALDELGLVAAVRHQASTYGSLVTVAGVSEIEPAPSAAVEVAAYRIATEAMANAVQHAGADRIVVGIHIQGEWLAVTVDDDGVGIPEGVWEPRAPGVDRAGLGLTSLRERAAEVGGRFSVGRSSTSDRSAARPGTRVRAMLPLVPRPT